MQEEILGIRNWEQSKGLFLSDISGANKPINQSVKTEHFKMESIHMLSDLLKAGDWRPR